MRQPTVYIGMTPTLRLRIETTIENLVALLDEVDGEADLEDGADGEPYLAGTAGTTDDREYDGDDLEPDVFRRKASAGTAV